jgi:hypothetical protein
MFAGRPCCERGGDVPYAAATTAAAFSGERRPLVFVSLEWAAAQLIAAASAVLLAAA